MNLKVVGSERTPAGFAARTLKAWTPMLSLGRVFGEVQGRKRWLSILQLYEDPGAFESKR